MTAVCLCKRESFVDKDEDYTDKKLFGTFFAICSYSGYWIEKVSKNGPAYPGPFNITRIFPLISAAANTAW